MVVFGIDIDKNAMPPGLQENLLQAGGHPGVGEVFGPGVEITGQGTDLNRDMGAVDAGGVFLSLGMCW